MTEIKQIYTTQPLAAWHQILMNGAPVAWTHKEDDASMLVRFLNEREELVKPQGVLEMTLLDIEMGISLLHVGGTDPEGWLDSARQKLNEILANARGTS